jgi:glycosyltransferase involved in cell wall biosynthesis
MIKLSLCMATFKRADFLAETLDAIIPQLCEGVELVIVDGASPDDTAGVVSRYVSEHRNIRYYRETVNSGIDGDYDKAVEYGRGQYCWLVADDDLLAPGAVARVLEQLEDDQLDLLVVDSEVRDINLERVLQPKRLGFSEMRRYGPDDADRFLADAGDALTFIGCVIIRRDVWMSRERRRYYGTVFIHVGVIFQAPHLKSVMVLPEPLVIIRLGNAMWTPKAFEIWTFKWPELVHEFEGYSDKAKAAVTPRQPYRELPYLLMSRATGAYGLGKYRHHLGRQQTGSPSLMPLFVALLPGRTLNFVSMCRLALRGKAEGVNAYVLLRSAYSNWASRAVAKLASRARAK